MNEQSFLEKLKSTYDPQSIEDTECFQNTKLLLNLYSKISWRSDEVSAISGRQITNNLNLYDLASALSVIDMKADYIKHGLNSAENCRSVIAIIDSALEMLRNHPENGERMHTILKNTYSRSKAQRLKEADLTYSLNISRSTYYREKKRAVNLLGIILWGFILPDLINSKNK